MVARLGLGSAGFHFGRRNPLLESSRSLLLSLARYRILQRASSPHRPGCRLINLLKTVTQSVYSSRCATSGQRWLRPTVRQTVAAVTRTLE